MKNTEYIYVAFPGYLDQLLRELPDVVDVRENLVFSKTLIPNPCFALDIWLNPQQAQFESINEAVRLLKEKSFRWFLYPLENIRRARLIEEKFKNPFAKKMAFPIAQKIPEVGAFTLLDEKTIIYSLKRWKKIPFGLVEFEEDKKNPPNRAYLKLWEALTSQNIFPKSNQVALDLGSSPGGWTWVLQKFGTKVYSIDKAPLDPKIAKLPNVEYIAQSAFALDPRDFPAIDFLCADIACYPDRLFSLVEKWRASGKVRTFICTIKLQGDTDFEAIQKFQSIPGAKVQHLYYNKHEATLIIQNAT